MYKPESAMPVKSNASIKKEHDQFLFPCIKPLYKEPVAIVQGDGVYVTDADGETYLDLFAGILTTSIGHCHPEVTERVNKQAARLGHTSTLYLTENQISAARKIASIAPGELQTCCFTNSGTEAVETAIMLAQLYTGRQEIVALRLAYSGRSALATNITAHASWRPVASAVPYVKHALSPYAYRSALEGTEEELAEKFARDIEEVIVTCTNGKPAAFFAETIQGVGGYIVPPKGYFQRAAEIIRSYGGLFICDEVQAGFGRTGDKWFGIEHWDVAPDIMVAAKGVANGYPVSVTITRPEIAEAWTAKTISTFGGNPVSMAAANATLDVMMREEVPRRSAERGAQLRAGLERLYNEFEWIGEVRGMGLMQAMELVEDRASKTPSPQKTAALLEATKQEKLLVGAGGLHGQVIRMGPSMLITAEEMEEALARLHRACQRVQASLY